MRVRPSGPLTQEPKPTSVGCGTLGVTVTGAGGHVTNKWAHSDRREDLPSRGYMTASLSLLICETPAAGSQEDLCLRMELTR